TDKVNGDPSNGALNSNGDGPAAQNKIGAGKLAANTPIGGRPASKSPVDPNTISQIPSAGDGDAAAAAQYGINAPLPKNPIDQSASNTGEDAATLARMANAVQAPAAKPAAGDTIQAYKSVRTASDIATGGQPG